MRPRRGRHTRSCPRTSRNVWNRNNARCASAGAPPGRTLWPRASAGHRRGPEAAGQPACTCQHPPAAKAGIPWFPDGSDGWRVLLQPGACTAWRPQAAPSIHPLFLKGREPVRPVRPVRNLGKRPGSGGCQPVRDPSAPARRREKKIANVRPRESAWASVWHLARFKIAAPYPQVPERPSRPNFAGPRGSRGVGLHHQRRSDRQAPPLVRGVPARCTPAAVRASTGQPVAGLVALPSARALPACI